MHKTGIIAVLVGVTILTACAKTENVEIIETATPAMETETVTTLPEETTAPETTALETEPEIHEQEYVSDNGWTAVYDPSATQVRETNKRVTFVQNGNAGTYISLTSVEGKQPEELLYEVTEKWADQELIVRSEQYFPNAYGKWAFRRDYEEKEEDKTIASKMAIATEYNGNIFLVEASQRLTGDEEKDMAGSDMISNILGSLNLKEFGPQEMFAYIPGTYKYNYVQKKKKQTPPKEAEYTIELSDDHTGILNFDRPHEVLWGSIALFEDDNQYEYTVEGETLFLTWEGKRLEFIKEVQEESGPVAEEMQPEDQNNEDKQPEEAVKISESEIEEIVARYMTTVIAQDYDTKGQHSIPTDIIMAVDDSDPDDIAVYGDFVLDNYSLIGDVLVTESGGSYPGVMHIGKNEEGEYEVFRFDVVQDGSGWDRSARRLFGDQYDTFMMIFSNDGAKQEFRNDAIRKYVKENKLKATKYQDYGWDPVAIE